MPETLDMFGGAKKNGAEVELPEWLDTEIWRDFQQHRKEIHAKLTPTATQRMFKHLEKYLALGVNPNEAIEFSIRNQWRGVFPEKLLENKNNGNGSNGKYRTHETAVQRATRKERDELARLGYPQANDHGGIVETIA